MQTELLPPPVAKVEQAPQADAVQSEPRKPPFRWGLFIGDCVVCTMLVLAGVGAGGIAALIIGSMLGWMAIC